ncbi:hypothetical protein CMK11_22020 [Candidatus Poribacteria bacterium]|nr:hypothetical protein [Candidatus Poribacteria bacterium]
MSMRGLACAVCFVACGVISAWPALPTPLLYLPFDEGSGPIVADHSGNGADAELFGSTDWTDRPGGGSAVEFGEVAWAEVPHDDMLHLTEAMTVACWARIDGDFGDQQMAIEKGPVWGPGEYSLLPDFEDRTLFQANDLPEGCDDELRGPDIRDGAWHHLAGTYDGIFLRIYVDGLLQEDPAEPAFPVEIPCEGDILTNDDPIYIASRGGTTRWTMGAYDDIAIFGEALNAAEVMELTRGIPDPVNPAGRVVRTWASLKAR